MLVKLKIVNLNCDNENTIKGSKAGFPKVGHDRYSGGHGQQKGKMRGHEAII